MSYNQTLQRVETYFDKTATGVWERLTSDAPVSRIRETVRRGRDEMRARMLSRLPTDLKGVRVLDAGCGAGQMTAELALRGANVVAIDISPSLVEIAEKRLPDHPGKVTFKSGDMLSDDLGRFDYVLAMDSLIYYALPDLTQALKTLSARTARAIIFTTPPRTPMLMAMWYAGKAFPRADRSPVMIPQSPRKLAKATAAFGEMESIGRTHVGFYISEALELRPC